MADQSPDRLPTPDEQQILDDSQTFFDFTAAAETKQRQEEAEDLKFDLGGVNQWPEAIVTERKGIPGQIAARPMLTINKLRQPCRQVVNQARLSRFGIKVSPIGTAKKKTAEIRQGMIRHIEVTSNAQQARIWAFTRAVKAGRGFYRVSNKYANDGDFQLDLSVDRILDQAAVYLDPTAKLADWSDMQAALIVDDLTESQYKRDYPKTQLASCSSFEAIGNPQTGWVWQAHGETVIRVAEYFWVETTLKTLALLGDGTALAESDVKKRGGPKVVSRREVPVRRVKWMKRNGNQIISPARDWPGRYIPIIPVLGDELYVEGERFFEGIIRQARDPQRSYNVMRSSQVETIGAASKSPWVLDPEQIRGYEHLWNQANVRNYAWLPRKRFVEGRDLGEVYHVAFEPAIQAITLAAHEADMDIHAVTGFEEASLGKLNTRDRSGKAIDSLVAQGERGSFNFVDNLGIAVTHEARILNDLLGSTYKEPGRVQRILGKDDAPRTVMLNIPFAKDGTGQPQAMPPVAPGMEGQPPQMPPGVADGAEIEHYDLNEGEFSVVVTVGKSTATENEEASGITEGIMESAPQLTPIIADLYVRRLSFPGSEEMADRLKKALPPQFQEDEEDAAQKIPPKVQAQIQQADQMLSMLQKELDAKNDLIEKEGLKYEHEEGMLRQKLASAERLAGLKLEVEIFKIEHAAAGVMAKLKAGSDLQGAEAELSVLQQRLSELHDMSLAKEQGAQAEAADARQATLASQADARKGQQAQQADMRTGVLDQQADARAGQMAEQADQRAVQGDQQRMQTQAALLPKPAPGAQ